MHKIAKQTIMYDHMSDNLGALFKITFSATGFDWIVTETSGLAQNVHNETPYNRYLFIFISYIHVD